MYTASCTWKSKGATRRTDPGAIWHLNHVRELRQDVSHELPHLRVESQNQMCVRRGSMPQMPSAGPRGNSLGDNIRDKALYMPGVRPSHTVGSDSKRRDGQGFTLINEWRARRCGDCRRTAQERYLSALALHACCVAPRTPPSGHKLRLFRSFFHGLGDHICRAHGLPSQPAPRQTHGDDSRRHTLCRAALSAADHFNATCAGKQQHQSKDGHATHRLSKTKTKMTLSRAHFPRKMHR